jgi:hypothetical protein
VHGGFSLDITESASGKLLFCCRGNDCDYWDIQDALRDMGIDGYGTGFVDGPSRNDDEVAIVKLAQRIKSAYSIYRRGAADPLVGTYLRSRGITLAVPPILRFLRYAPHRDRQSYPAMLAPVVDCTNRFIGCHATFLNPDGSGKYPFADKTQQRECRGPIKGGAVRLALYDPSCELLVSEGIETALSCMQLFDLPAWAALSDSGIRALELPAEVEAVAIAVDNDKNDAGQEAALAAYHHWTDEGRSVRLLMPPNAGDDFNDVLLRGPRA